MTKPCARAFLDILEVPPIADPSALSILIVLDRSLASIKNAGIHALAHVEWVQSVWLSTTTRSVAVRHGTQEIPSFDANRLLRYQYKVILLTLAIHRHVVRTRNVGLLGTPHRALALTDTLVRPLIVDQNALAIPSVPIIWHASDRNVKIPARTRVVKMRSVEL